MHAAEQGRGQHRIEPSEFRHVRDPRAFLLVDSLESANRAKILLEQRIRAVTAFDLAIIQLDACLTRQRSCGGPKLVVLVALDSRAIQLVDREDQHAIVDTPLDSATLRISREGLARMISACPKRSEH